MRKGDKSLVQKCFYNKNGICDLDGNRCELLPCQQFKSFDGELRKEINSKIRQQENKIGRHNPVDKYALDIAFGCMPEDETIQNKL